MDTFVWNEHFTTGLAVVDEQHQVLVRLINDLGTDLVGGDALNSLDETFARLALYARRHFADEEDLMVAAGLPSGDVDHHRAKHAEFIEQVGRMWNARSSMSNPVEVLHGFLSAWLAFHILGEDQEMAGRVLGRTPGQPGQPDLDAANHGEGATTALLHALKNLYHVLSVQNHDLANANTRLEERVAERTRELEVANTALRSLSRTDGLLGIANRAFFDEQLLAEWARARRTGHLVGLIMFDVDHFKRYNDSLGHPAGDRCLQAVAGAIGWAIRRQGDLLARYGGEELVVILPNVDAGGVRTVAQNALSALTALNLPHPASPTAPCVTLSAGVAVLRPAEGADPGELLAAADRALYRAKGSWRNRVCGAERVPEGVPEGVPEAGAEGGPVRGS